MCKKHNKIFFLIYSHIPLNKKYFHIFTFVIRHFVSFEFGFIFLHLLYKSNIDKLQIYISH